MSVQQGATGGSASVVASGAGRVSLSIRVRGFVVVMENAAPLRATLALCEYSSPLRTLSLSLSLSVTLSVSLSLSLSLSLSQIGRAHV